MVTYIRQLLFRHDCVVLPGLGAIIANYQPARMFPRESKICPPSKSLAFNRSLKQHDGLLIMEVAQQESIPYKAAEERVDAYIRSIQEALEKHRSFLLKDIGRLYVDKDNNLLFEPAGTVNFLIESNSLPELNLVPVERLKQGAALDASRPRIENDRDVEALLADIEANQKSATVRSNIPYWISVVLVIGFLSTIVGLSLQRDELTRISYSSFFPDLKALRLNPVPEAIPEPEVSVTVPETDFSETELASEPEPEILPVAEPVQETVPEPASLVEVPKAYIVVGAFFDQQYADKAKAEAAEKGYRSVQVDDYNGTLHRVMVETDINRVDTDLQSVKSTLNARAWVYCANCSY